MNRRARFYAVPLLAVLVLLAGCFQAANPEYTIEGIEDGGEYSAPVTIVVKPANKHTKLDIFLNDEPFVSGTEVFMPGTYELKIVAFNGKADVVHTYAFTIDHDLPLITIAGVENGGYYHEPVTPVITTDGGADQLEITLNGKPFASGTEIAEDGIYELKATAVRPPANGTASVVYTFEVRIGVPAVHYFSIAPKSETDLTPVGFSADRAVLTVNTEMVPPGEDVSIKLAQTDPKASLRVRNHHPDWIKDWTPYDMIGFWIYIGDVDTLHKELPVRLKYPMDGPYRRLWTLDELKDGWNYLTASLRDDLGLSEEQLADMTMDGANSRLFEIKPRSPYDPVELITVYFSGIKLYMSDKVK